MEDMVADLVGSGISVELLVGSAIRGGTVYGIRLRTFGKLLPKNRMVLAHGETFTEALIDAISKAEAGRWENLDWAKRPWETAPKFPYGARYGFDAPGGSPGL